MCIRDSMDPEEALEAHIVNELSKARDKAGRISDSALSEDNSGVIMARTGARGSSLNLGQMTAALGQQSVRGKRIQNGFDQRALSHFAKGDKSPDSKGFVKSNYRTGLTPTEFFFHAMGGREGLVDTAVRTQQSGYMQRRLINALEHIRVEYDKTVRDAHGNIIQYLYGEDGIDPAKSDHSQAVNIDRQVEIAMIDDTSKIAPNKSEIESALKYSKSKFESILPGNTEILDKLSTSFKEHNITSVGMKNVIKKTLELSNRALIEPGEASGIVAAQSIGVPVTHMTLRSFHFAGVKERDVTLGLPRLIELVDARKVPSTPTMNIYLHKNYSSSQTKALEIAKLILYTTVSDLINSVSSPFATIRPSSVASLIAVPMRNSTPFFSNALNIEDSISIAFSLELVIAKTVGPEPEIVIPWAPDSNAALPTYIFNPSSSYTISIPRPPKT